MAKWRVTFVWQHCGNIGTKFFMCVIVVFKVVTGCFRSVSCAQDCDSVRRAMRIGGEILKLDGHKLCAWNMFCLRHGFFPQGSLCIALPACVGDQFAWVGTPS